jgi:hypothetical protein
MTKARPTEEPEGSITPIGPAENQPKELSPEVQAALSNEQEMLNKATMEAQLSYLTQRVAELTKENLELKGAQT